MVEFFFKLSIRKLQLREDLLIAISKSWTHFDQVYCFKFIEIHA